MNVLPFFMSAQSAPDISELFATSLYTGNGSTQTITNGIDLLNEGGAFVAKNRGATGNWGLYDTERGSSNLILINSTSGQGVNALGSFLSNGVEITNTSGFINQSANTYVGYFFRKHPKFFDVVTFTHTNGVTSNVATALTIPLGLATVKRLDSASDWYTNHRSLTAGNNLRLNTTAAESTTNAYVSFSGSTVVFASAAPSGDYALYVWGHDTSGAGLIQQVSFATDGSGAGSYAHGWAEGVQLVDLKAITTTGDWERYDTTRSPSWTTDLRLRPNLSNAEDTVTRLSDTGGTVSFTNLSASQTYIASLIRAPS